MRVLFFNEGNLGNHVMGQGQLAQALRAGLAETPDVQASFAGLRPMGRLSALLASRPLPALAERDLDPRALRWHLVQSVRARGAIASSLGKWPADVLHVHTQSVALALAGRMRRTPTVLSVDATIGDWAAMSPRSSLQSYAPGPVAPSRALERRAYERARLTMAWSAWAKRGVERLAPSAQVIEHHPGIDLDRYRPAPRRSRERLRVLFVGGRFAQKGGPELLAALSDRLGREEVDLDLVTPARLPELRGVRVHRLRPGDPLVLDLQQQADLLCLPSHGDAVPWAVLEAMACGTPVLASRVGGIPDLLGDGSAGMLVEPRDDRQLGEALARLLGDAELRRQLAGRARERCEQRYDVRRQVPLLVARLRELCGAATPS
ncbi:MAG: glycosyltransferase family 4 protein [Solirubrobacteraceae bacterium]